MSNTKIFSAYHLPATLPSSTSFVASQVGRAIKPDLGLPHHDAQGEHISDKNGLYSELTLQYQIWKNELGSLDFVGLCHYRRLFNPYGSAIIPGGRYTEFEYGKQSRPIAQWSPDSWDQLTSDDCLRLMTERAKSANTDFVTLQPFWKTNRWSLWTLAGLDWLPVRSVIEFFEYCRIVMPHGEFGVFNWAINESLSHYCNNMIFARSEIFDDYSSWLFPILFGYEQHLREVEARTGLTLIVPRMFGYFSEYMLRPWSIIHQKRVAHVDSICFSDMKLDARV